MKRASDKRNPESRKRRDKAYRTNNPEKVKAAKEKYLNNPDNRTKDRQHKKQYEERNKSKIAEYRIVYRKTNREKINLKNHLYRANNKEKTKAKYLQAKFSLPDYFVASRLGLPVASIPQSLIDLKRAQVQIARTLKELNDAPSKSNKRG